MPRLRTLGSSCPSLARITIIDGPPTETTESDFDVYIFKEKILKLTKSLQMMMLVSIVLIKHNQLTCLFLDVPSQQVEKDNWRKSATFAKIEDKSYKVIVDSEICINAISSKSLEYLGLEVVPHFHHSKCL